MINDADHSVSPTIQAGYEASLRWFHLITCVHHPDHRISRPALEKAFDCVREIFEIMHSWVLAHPECQRLCAKSCLLYQIAYTTASQESWETFGQVDTQFRETAEKHLPGYQNIYNTCKQLGDLYATCLKGRWILDDRDLLPMAYRQHSLWHGAMERPPLTPT